MPARHTVFFLGTPAFAVPSLEALIADDTFDVQLVITQPDKPVGRKQELTPPPVKVAALKHGIEIFQPENINTQYSDIPIFRYSRPDFLVTVAYGKILSKEILALPKVAPLNVHASLLPRWRGASPIEHAILAGDKETGVTIQIMAQKMDEGAILGMSKTSIDQSTTALTLREELSQMGARLLLETLKAPLQPQEQDHSQATYCHKLSREDGLVDAHTMTAEEIDRKVRALVPWPGVLLTIDGQPLKLLQTSLEQMSDSASFSCAQGTTLHLVSVQVPGKKPMSGKAWGNGKRLGISN